ncbi:MAG: hypothetical protein B0D92_03510 [Spirochaeta sp. LUC14_002_19_P3]|nr:MAG: hypothetical protein B0D92_03510 [Spirochaeta sp. LUC14_002_19_P3]
MSIAKLVVNRPTTFFIVYALIVGLAVYMVFQIPIELMPDITQPTINIETSYPGAGPEEVEKSVTRPIEGVLNSISNLKGIESSSSEGLSVITLKFTWGIDWSESTNEVRDKLETVKDSLPKEAKNPQIYKWNFNEAPILNVALYGNRSSDELRAIAKRQIVPKLEQVDGVGNIGFWGGRNPQVNVDVSQVRLKAYGITMSQIIDTLKSQNLGLSSGTVQEGSVNYVVSVNAEYSSLHDIRNTVISYKTDAVDPITGKRESGKKPIYLSDLADVYEGYSDITESVYFNGDPAVGMDIKKRSGTNSVEVTDRIIKQLDIIRSELPDGVILEEAYEATKIIRKSLNGVRNAAMLGAVLAILVLFFFLRNFTSTIIIGLSIPISLLITLMVMYMFNLTLNVMTLAGLSLGIGMIVDSSIVILESIYRYREKGANLLKASHLGTQEMIAAIVASTLTTVLIFAPLLLFKKDLDFIGVLFTDLSITIVVSLMASLIVAMSLVPMLTSKFLKIYTREQKPIKSKALRHIDDGMENMFKGMENFYQRILSHVLDNKFICGLILLLVFIISLFALEPLGGNIGVTVSPDIMDDMVRITLWTPVGTKQDITHQTVSRFSDVITEEVENYGNILSIAGGTGHSANRGQIIMVLPPKSQQTDSKEDISRKLSSRYDEFPSVNFNTQRSSTGGVQPIDVVFKTDDIEGAQVLALNMKEYIDNQVDAIEEVQLSFNESLPVASVVIDRKKAYSYGFNMRDIASEISSAVNGTTAGRYITDGEGIDIAVRLREEDRSSIPDLQNIFITDKTGKEVAVSSIASIERGVGPVTINREERIRVIHLRAYPAQGVSLQEGNRAVRQAIEENFIVPDHIILQYGGALSDLGRYMKKFMIIMLIALAMVYGTMASIFESFLDPFIIFISIFMVIPGILLMYWFMNLPFFGIPIPMSMFSAVGLLMLVGISVNNGIVLLDYTNLLRSRGLPLKDAIISAGGNRLRPILMTSLTTILCMIPLAFSQADGSEMIRPLGITIVGGMLMGTVTTLFLVPMLYAAFNARKGGADLQEKKYRFGWLSRLFKRDKTAEEAIEEVIVEAPEEVRDKTAEEVEVIVKAPGEEVTE